MSGFATGLAVGMASQDTASELGTTDPAVLGVVFLIGMVLTALVLFLIYR